MKLKKYFLYAGIVVCLAASILYFCFKKSSAPPYRNASKMEILKNDNILETVKEEVTDFLWRGYAPNQYPTLDKKLENILPEILPYIHSTPILKAYKIEKMAYENSFDEIPQCLQTVLSFLQGIQSEEPHSTFLRKMLPVFSSLTRIQINYNNIPENVLRQEITILDSLDNCVSKFPSVRGNKYKETVLFYIRANKILAMQKLGLYSAAMDKNIQDPFDSIYALKLWDNNNGTWEIRSCRGFTSNGKASKMCDWLPLFIEDQVSLNKEISPVLSSNLYEDIKKLWINEEIETMSKHIILRNRNGDLTIEPKDIRMLSQ